METQKSNVGMIVVGIVIGLCCVCLIALGLGGYGLYSLGEIATTETFSTITVELSTTEAATPTAEVVVTRPPVEEIKSDTLQSLQMAIVPENDPYELACRLQKICDVSKTVAGKKYAVGDKEKFWIINADTNEHNEITATLLYITPHSYFWAEDGVDANKKDVKSLMDAFEEKIYPTDREFFGNEWIPGVDEDEHIFVIYAESLGSNVGGYFNSSDSYNPIVKKYSNAHETYVLGASQSLADEYAYSTLAHEFVHMIQFASDRNDVSWISEGFAEVGAFLNGYSVGGADWAFMQNPDMQLNTWVDNSSDDFGPHYGASFLYLVYYLDRFGKDATIALTKNPENDLQSVDDTLSVLNVTDPVTGKIITADDVFMDWAVTNFLLDGSVGDGRYVYHNYADAPQALPTESITSCPQSSLSRDVHQYGADYISIECAGDYTLSFTGSTATGLLPVDPYSGQYAFWSNKGDESDMTLTREFDFTNATAPITFSFQTWYDVEKDYDYVYLEVSDDGGKTWQIVTTPFGTAENPTGGSYGWAYNGTTNDWIKEDVDLSAYAGKKVSVRFEYVTDAALNGEGFLLDDVSIDAINYTSDFETGDDGWVADGFVRVQNSLPQTFQLALIIKGDQTTVEMIPLNEDQTAEIKLSLKAGEQAILVVSGTTRFTREHATYQIEIR